MVKRITFILFNLVFMYSVVFAQCNNNMKTKCLPSLASYTVLKTYLIELEKRKSKRKLPPKARYSLMLSKGTRYRISGCVDEATNDKMIFTLFDNMGEVSSSYNKQSGKHYPAFEFICNKSGVYYITFHFKNGSKGCGGANIAMRKKSKSSAKAN